MMDRYTMRKRIIAISLNKKRFLSGVFLTLLATVVNAQLFPYQQAGLPVSQRVDDLMMRMTLEEKIAQIRHLHSWDIFNEQTLDKEKLTAVVGETGYGFVEGFPLTGENCRSSMREIQEYMLTRTRLGIPAFTVAESLHGSAHEGSTIFPQNIALGSTFNPELAYRRACMTADDLHAQGMRQVLAPCIDVVRDLRWGRVEESYGEDPYLCGIFAQSEVKGYLDSGISPMLKHYGPHGNPLGGLNLASVDCGLYDLHAVYLKPFEMVLRHLPVYAVMSTYNSWNRIPNSASRYLLTDILRDRWGFKGYVVSDCGGPSLLVNAHKYVKTKEAAAALSIKAGLDLECGDDVYDQPLLSAYRQYMVTDADIDSAAYRVLRARMELGLFDSGEQNPYTKISPAVIGSAEHQEVALNAARECIVLLKNQKKMLPLNAKKVKSIAVVGINAGSSEFGDYSGLPVIAPISVLQGIKDRVGDDVKVVYAPWKSAVDGMELIQGASFPEGLKAEYFDNTKLQGTPKVRKEEWINFEPANQAPDPFLPKSPLSVRWTGKLRPTVTGQYTLSFTSDDGCRLSIDGKMLIDAWQAHAVSTDSASIYLEAGKEYQLKAEYYDNRDYAIAKLQWKVPQIGKATRLDLYGEAGKAVRECETVVAVMGINKSIEREGQDRYDIQLPADQREFLQEIYKVNPNIIVVLVAGSSLAINWMDEHIPAIVNAWYPGEQGGTAVAEVLFGDYNPAGRLPLTYYKSLDELPPFDDYDITKGRTYKYFKGDVLYPFGYGLSYSSFKYSDLQVKDGVGEVTVSFRLKNTGKRNGDEVAQVYVRIPETGGIVPLKELKGFCRVPLKSGESRRVEIKLDKEQLRYWDVEKGQFVVPKGAFDVMVGASSKDIRLQTVIDL